MKRKIFSVVVVGVMTSATFAGPTSPSVGRVLSPNITYCVLATPQAPAVATQSGPATPMAFSSSIALPTASSYDAALTDSTSAHAFLLNGYTPATDSRESTGVIASTAAHPAGVVPVAVPLPAAAPAGLITLGLLACLSMFKRFRRLFI